MLLVLSFYYNKQKYKNTKQQNKKKKYSVKLTLKYVYFRALYIQIFPIKVTVLCRSDGARFVLHMHIRQIRHTIIFSKTQSFKCSLLLNKSSFEIFYILAYFPWSPRCPYERDLTVTCLSLYHGRLMYEILDTNKDIIGKEVIRVLSVKRIGLECI